MIKEIGLGYGFNEIFLMVPDSCIIYQSNYPVVYDTPAKLLTLLAVTPHSLEKQKISGSIQNRINQAVSKGEKIVLFPEGPYCSPVEK